MNRNKKYWNDLANYFSGEMNEKEKTLFNEEISQSHQLKSDFELMKNTWNDSGNIIPDDTFDTKKAWKELQHKFEDDGILRKDTGQVKSNDFRYAIRLAAIITIILAVGIPAIYLSIKEITTPNAYIEKTTNETQEIFELPDGSRVFLNEGAKLRYHKNYSDKREVKLNGEGYFEVMSDPAKPFHVKTGRVVVTVLGTAFNIREEADESVEVYVESGTVEVTLLNSEKSIVLKQGDLARANNDIVFSELKDLNYLSWKTKEFQFIDKPLPEIIQILESAYHVQVNYSNIPASEMNLTTTYKGQTFEAILNTICTAFNIHYKKEGKVYILQTK